MSFKEFQIVKIGTQSLFREHDRIDINKINDVGYDVRELRDQKGIMSVLVTSGAISLGRMATSLTDLDDHITQARVAASIGQVELMSLYKLSIGEEVAQIMPTHNVLHDGPKAEEFAKMMHILIKKGVFPIVNYNDAADDYELKHISNFADNDTLTQALALLLKADRVIILSNIDGFMDPDGNLIEKVTLKDDFERLSSYCQGKSNKGTGGMASKLKTARILMEAGIEMVIANVKYPLADIVEGKVPRTVFQA